MLKIQSPSHKPKKGKNTTTKTLKHSSRSKSTTKLVKKFPQTTPLSSPYAISTTSFSTQTGPTIPVTDQPNTNTNVTTKKKSKKQSINLTLSTDVKTHTPIQSSPHGVLVRDFIRESLYSKQGYFNASRVINSPGVINFSQLLGKAAYEKRLDELYFAGIQGWTTPVEIFQPFYAQSLARYFISHTIPAINDNSMLNVEKLRKMLQFTKDKYNKKGLLPKPNSEDEHIQLLDGLTLEQDSYAREFGLQLTQPDKTTPINNMNISIIEIGGGNGTCATNIMDFLHTYYPNVYKATNYTIFEMSETLSWQQRELLDAQHQGKYQVFTKNAAEIDFSTLSNNFKQLHNISTNTSTTHPSFTLAQQQQSTSTTSTLPPQRRPGPTNALLQEYQKATASTDNQQNNSKKSKDHAFIFGLEVLDNMVHDKVIKGYDGKWYQVMVAEKSAITKVQSDANDNPEKEYKFPLYEHPKDVLLAQHNKLKVDYKNTNTNTNDTSNTNTNNNNNTTQSQTNPMSSSSTTTSSTSSKRKYTNINASTLAQYMSKEEFPVNYALLNTAKTSTYFEYVMPIYDPIIQECAEFYSAYSDQKKNSANDDGSNNLSVSSQQNQTQPQHAKGGIFNWLQKRILARNLANVDEVVYLPTELLRFIHRVNILYPSHTLLLADFDALPTTEKIPAINAPVVAHKATESQLRGKTKDEPSYLVPLGLCDIFFPTDFNFVKHMYTAVCLNGETPSKQHISPLSQPNVQQGSGSDVILSDDLVKKTLSKPTPIQNTTIAVTQETFLNAFADVEKTQCKNGFNPMLNDYHNMALFIGQRA